MLEEKRKTRGNRMTDLIGEAAEEDATFWGDAVWAEDSEDDSFGSEDEVVKPDEFDSDFDESEGSEEEGSDNEENARKAVRRASSSNKYKEPPAERKRKALPDHENAGEAVSSPRLKKPKAERRPSDQSLEGMNFERTVRESTKTKSEVAHISRLASQSSDKSRPVYVKPKIHHFTQKELLLDALETEVKFPL